MISEVANAPAPIPLAWLDEELATGIMSRLTEFLATISDPIEPLVSVHEVLHRFVQQLGSAKLPQVKETRTPALSNILIETLLKLGRYEEAARSMEQLAQEWFRRAEAPSLFIGWMERLPEDIKQNHLMLKLVLARALSLRAHTGDTDHARVILQNLLARDNLSDGQRLQAMQHAADIAIRQHNYGEAIEWVQQAQRLVRSAPGIFDETPLQTLATRISWEQGQFQEALTALAGSTLHSGADGARLASWEGRAYASLGNFAAAAKAVQRGLEIARREHIRRAEAYNAVLLAEYELVRGNFSRSRRLADRALELAKIIGQPNLEAQALMVEAELAVTDLRVAEAQKFLSLAQDALTQRADDSWSHCYLLVSQARVAQMQPDWIRLYSLARFLEAEAKVMGSIVPRHPVVQAMRVEAAWCWATANYMHEARRVLATVERSQCEWRTGWDAQRLELIAGRHSAAVFEQMAQQLIRNAQEAGCPYLAATCGYTAASYGWQRGFSQLASYYAHWTSQVAKSRGWTTLALMAQGIALTEAESELAAPGQVITHDAHPRGQQRAREDTGLPIVDPYEE